MKFTLFFSCSLAAVSFGLEQPDSFLRHRTTDAERDLQLTDGALACERQLSICEAVVGDKAVPTQKMVAFLEMLDGDTTDTLVDDLIVILERSANTTFAPLVSSVHENAKAQTVLSTVQSVALEVKSFDKQEPQGVLAVMIDALTQLDAMLGQVNTPDLVPTQIIPYIIFLLEFVAGLLGVLGSGPIGIVTYILGAVIEFIQTFLGGLVTVALFPKADEECQSELMACSYAKLLLEAVPGIVGAIFIAETTA